MRPALYLDECVDRGAVPLLRQRGFSTVTALDVGLLSATDHAQLRYAAANALVLVSNNRRHFERLHRRFLSGGETHAGIILVPSTGPFAQLAVRITMLADELVRIRGPSGQLLTWGALQYRMTQGYRLPGYDEADVRLALGQARRTQ